MADMQKIDELIKTAALNDLAGVEWLQTIDKAVIQESYNGIGPQFLPAALRDKVTQHFSTFEPAALIHDLRNEFSDGTAENFHAANNEFYVNCLKLVDAKYPWWRPARYLARRVAHAFYRFVDGAAGWRAWLEAQINHKKKNSKE